MLDSLFKCDTEVEGESLDWCSEAEALSRRCVEAPDHVVDAVIGVVSEAGLARQLAAQAAVAVLDRAALPGAVRVAEEGPDADGVLARRKPAPRSATSSSMVRASSPLSLCDGMGNSVTEIKPEKPN